MGKQRKKIDREREWCIFWGWVKCHKIFRHFYAFTHYNNITIQLHPMLNLYRGCETEHYAMCNWSENTQTLNNIPKVFCHLSATLKYAGSFIGKYTHTHARECFRHARQQNFFIRSLAQPFTVRCHIVFTLNFVCLCVCALLQIDRMFTKRLRHYTPFE